MHKGHRDIALLLVVLAVAVFIILTAATPDAPPSGGKAKVIETTQGTVVNLAEGLDPFPPSPPVTGAIFTTMPDGGIVNENVRYPEKKYVYLDGGPPPHAPAKAAGLKEGLYVFQVTDPSGAVLLSDDPSKCRIINVSSEGVIVGLVLPSTLGLGLTDNYTLDNPNSPKAVYVSCHFADEPTPPEEATAEDAGDTERHDTNVDVDYGTEKNATVVQLMPFSDTPNPGGVYKAWVTPLQSYLDNDGELDAMPKKQGKGYERDIGFGTPNSDVKTDNFKVKKQKDVPMLMVRKFHDIDGDGYWDPNEPEIGVDQCVYLNGTIAADCEWATGGGGWPVNITDTIPLTETEYTPVTVFAAVDGDYVVEEDILDGWAQSALRVDGAYIVPPTQNYTVTVAAKTAMGYEVVFGDYQKAKINGTKYIDMNGNGVFDPGENETCDQTTAVNVPGCSGVTVTLEGVDGAGNTVTPQTTQTDANGYFEFTDLRPGTYNITVTEPTTEFLCSYPNIGPTGCYYSNVVLKSGDEVTYDFMDLSLAELKGKKFEDMNGNGQWDTGEPGVPGVTVNLTGMDGRGNDVDNTTTTDANGEFRFTDLWPGTYWVTEEVPDGWVASKLPLTSGPHVLTSDNITDLGWVFGNYVPANKSGIKFIDLNGNRVFDSGEGCADILDQKAGCEGVIINLAGTGVDQNETTDANGAYGFTGLAPGHYTVTVLEYPEDGFYCHKPLPETKQCVYEVDLESGDNEVGNNFGDFLPAEIIAFKYFDFDNDGVWDENESGIPGIKFCLTDSNGDPVVYNLSNDAIADVFGCIWTDENGLAVWPGIMPGTYTLTEYLEDSGIKNLTSTTATVVEVVVISGESETVLFGNYGLCDGLTPGFWQNWDGGNPPENHYFEWQFEELLQGTVANGDVALAEQILTNSSCAEKSGALACLKRFVLATQLTLNMTQSSYWKPSDGSLFGQCLLHVPGGIIDSPLVPPYHGTLQEALATALDMLANPGDYTRDEILYIKDVLDEFANQGPSS